MNYSIDLADYGYNGECTPDVARVSAVHKERYGLITPFGMTYGFLKPGNYMLGDQPYPTTGDFVRIEFNPSGDSRIIETLPRRSLFSRMEAGPLMREQAVAANFDYVLLVTSLNHDFNPRRMERYLTVAFNSGASPVIVLTKADLCPDYQSKIAEMEITAPGVPVHAVSVYTGLGMDALGQYARPRATLVLLGSSGVGKSSLLNALAGSYEMRVNSTRDVDSSKGRHTTTHRQLIMLDSGAMVIDTPGMRELGMWCAGDGLDAAFPDVEAVLARGCRFSNCRHESEPGCAVRAALENGELDPERWRRYQALQAENRRSDERQALKRERQEHMKGIAIKRKELNRKGR